ncbi:MAG TPA: ABC transporter permease [Chloroflexota bacterium]|jgi:peptide/nickel transport system permease protein
MSSVATAAPRHAGLRVPLALVHASSAVYSSYVVRRVLKALLTIFLITTMTFFLVRLLPGNPVETYINTQIGQYGMSYADAANQAAGLFSFNPNEPLIQQYWEYLQSLSHGDLGRPLLSPGATVGDLIKTYLPWTLFSVGLGLMISFTLGIGLGMLIAYKREGPFDHVLTAIGSILYSVPNYLLAIMIVVFLGVQLGWLPITNMRGAYSPGVTPALSVDFARDALFHASLPITVYVLSTIGSWMLIMKSSTLATLDEDYVTAARARGLKDGRITTGYVGRNAVLPLFTQLAIAAGFIVGGSLLIEPLFQYQGIGWILKNAVNQRDYPVMQGIFLVVTVSVVMANLLADLLYGRLDPRIRIAADD